MISAHLAIYQRKTTAEILILRKDDADQFFGTFSS